MQINEVRARETRRTQDAPVNLEAGRLESTTVVQLYIITAGALAVAALGGLLANAGIAGAWSTWGWLATLSRWLAFFGALLLVLSSATAGAICYLAGRGWWQHQRRVEEWHKAQLNSYVKSGGQEHEREVLQRSLSLSEPLHALAVVAHVVERHRAGEAAPWASTALRGDVWFGQLKLGELSKTDAEAWSRALADVGLVRGRRPGAAGQLVTSDLAEALALMSRNHGRIVPGKIRQAADGAGED